MATLDGEQQQGSDAVDPIVLVPSTATGGAVDNLTKALLVHVFKYNFPGTYMSTKVFTPFSLLEQEVITVVHYTLVSEYK